MLKQSKTEAPSASTAQPPSGGCVLKHARPHATDDAAPQPPSGGCVLKPFVSYTYKAIPAQPPSGGCVLKLRRREETTASRCPAAFRRLCVETDESAARICNSLPAAFRRLCVETKYVWAEAGPKFQPPSGGCVLKLNHQTQYIVVISQPPSGGCVLKQSD